ncbi:MAG: O-antigen ligase family protein [Alphaproteobacteria bacterium]
MFTLERPNKLFEITGLVLLGLQFAVFVFGLPPFQAGFWYQTEPTLLAIFLLATATAAWLGYGLHSRILQLQAPSLLWKIIFLWIGWQLLTLPLANTPWASWFGAPEIAEGTGWYVSVLICTCAISVFWKQPHQQRLIIWMAAVSMMTEVLFHLANFGDPDDIMLWRPARWPDYLAFSAGYLWLAVTASGHSRQPTYMLALIALTYSALLISTNLTAMILMGIALMAAVITSYPRLPTRLQALAKPGRFWRGFSLAACVLPLLWVGFSAGSHHLALDKRQDAIGTLSDNDDSMGARILINRMAVRALLEEPQRLVIGSGWGNFSNDSYKYALVEGVRAYENGIRKANAQHIYGSAFHSHSEPMEVLLSFGLIGLVLWFAIHMLVIRRMPTEGFWHTVPMMVAIVCLYYFWFVLPQVLAYQALAWCALCAALQGTPSPATPKLHKASLLVVAALVFTMAGSAWAQYRALQFGDDVNFVPRNEMPTAKHTAWLMEEIGRGGERLRVGAENFALWGWDVSNGKDTGNYDIHWHDNFLAAAEAMEQSASAGPRNRMLLLWYYYKLLLDYGDSEHAQLRSKATRGIKDSILLLSKLAPGREDIAAPFLMNLDAYTKGDIADSVEILANILAVHPEHRSALWLLGHIYLTEPQFAAEGERMIRHAVAAGVDRVYPISNTELEQWGDQAGVNVTVPAETNVNE